MPGIPAHIHLPAHPLYQPHTLTEAVRGLERDLQTGDIDAYEPVPLGLPLVDAALGGGVHLADLVYILGKQNVGKTILAVQAGLAIARRRRELVIKVSYEHHIPYVLLRLLTHASFQAGGAAPGVTRSQIEAAVLDYHRRRPAGEPLDLGYLLRAVPGLEPAWWVLRECLDYFWLVYGDLLETTPEYLEHYVLLARHYGFRRIVLIVDYLQCMPLSPPLARGLSVLERIDLATQLLKRLARNHHIGVVTVAAADAEGLRRQRVHLENAWGTATLQYAPDKALVLNPDQTDPDGTVRTIRLAIEKNRTGPSEIEWRHILHGAYYTVSPRGVPVPAAESFQSDRVGLAARS